MHVNVPVLAWAGERHQQQVGQQQQAAGGAGRAFEVGVGVLAGAWLGLAFACPFPALPLPPFPSRPSPLASP